MKETVAVGPDVYNFAVVLGKSTGQQVTLILVALDVVLLVTGCARGPLCAQITVMVYLPCCREQLEQCHVNVGPGNLGYGGRAARGRIALKFEWEECRG